MGLPLRTTCPYNDSRFQWQDRLDGCSFFAISSDIFSCTSVFPGISLTPYEYMLFPVIRPTQAYAEGFNVNVHELILNKSLIESILIIIDVGRVYPLYAGVFSTFFQQNATGSTTACHFQKKT